MNDRHACSGGDFLSRLDIRVVPEEREIKMFQQVGGRKGDPARMNVGRCRLMQVVLAGPGNLRIDGDGRIKSRPRSANLLRRGIVGPASLLLPNVVRERREAAVGSQRAMLGCLPAISDLLHTVPSSFGSLAAHIALQRIYVSVSALPNWRGGPPKPCQRSCPRSHPQPCKSVLYRIWIPGQTLASAPR